ncbi:hypothetical protein [Spiroplasma endosymbiont of Polydrusus pterygomalis]|uniref:hypothetical protein n=1 Tax=Spiroplasma endosymbiont of Polydrusus pterygomalis TaxID=3139327 RepID=UPI003CCA85B4
MNKKNEEIVKYLMLEKVQNLKEYAIYYSNYQKIIKTDIKNINNIENEKKHQDHTYAKSLY